ncbi:MAG: helix-turn-helix transcriptional regulator [Acidimicrobiales bacterium]
MALPENLAPELGRRIADLRMKRGWTQTDLAARLAISRTAVSHVEAGMSIPGERTVALLAGLFALEPHELVVGTDYPSAKAERLPVVVARYTEVEHQLALLESDLAWIERTDAQSGGPVVLEEWEVRLAALLTDTHDPGERDQLTDARRTVAERRRLR